MHIYLSPFEQYNDGAPGRSFRPATRQPWVGGILDLQHRGIDSCIVLYNDALSVLPSGVIKIGESFNEIPSAALVNSINSRIIQPVTRKELSNLISDIYGPSRTLKNGRDVIWLGGQKIKNVRVTPPRPATITYNETWPANEAQLSATGQDLDYTNYTGQLGDWTIASNTIQRYAIPLSVIENFRADSATDTDDNFAEMESISAFSRQGGDFGQFWVGCRYSGSEPTAYIAFIQHSSGGMVSRLRRMNNNSRTDITSDQAASLPFNMYVEADGDQITAIIDGVTHGPSTNASITTGKLGGLGGFWSSSVGAAALTGGPWSYGDLGTPPPTGGWGLLLGQRRFRRAI